MARKATGSGGRTSGSASGSKKSAGTSKRQVAASRASTSDDDGNSAADAFLKILQSPIVADLLAVAAMAALTALAEHGFSGRRTGDQRRAGRAMKEAGKAAAAAVGRRLANEVEEIRRASKAKRGEAA